MTETEDRNQTQVQTQTAEISISAGSFSAHVKVQATPAGLLAVGGLVGCILLSVTALVWVATTPMRRHPFATAALRR